MKTILCRKCGTKIDASLGECPVCGAMYYIVPDEPADDAEDVRIWSPGKPAGTKGDSDTGRGEMHTQQLPDIESFLNSDMDDTPASPSANRPTGSQRPAQPRPRYSEDTAPRPRYADGEPRQSQYPRGEGQGPRRTQYQDGRGENPARPQQDPRQQRGERPAQYRQDPRQTQYPQGERQGQRQTQYPRGEGQDPRRAQYQDGRVPKDPYGDDRRGGRTPDNRPPRNSDGRGKSDNKRKYFIIGACALVAVIVVIVCAMSSVFNFNKSNESATMPNLVGMTRSEAVEALRDLDLSLSISYETEDSDEPEDTVIKQSVKSSKIINKGDKILLTLSAGDGTDEKVDVSIPDLEGYTYDQAVRVAKEIGLEVQKLADEYGDAPAGEVLRQTPAAGRSAKSGDVVYVTLSRGPEPSPSPTPSPTPSIPTYSITVTSGKGGSISPRGQVSVTEGGSQSFTITPDSGYEVREVKIDGSSVGAVTSYVFNDVKKNHTIYAVFQLKPEPTPSPTPAPTPTPSPPPVDETPAD